MKIISYSIFGYNKEKPENCFDFKTYLRGLMINIRLAKVLYPGWRVAVNTDDATYERFEKLFNALQERGVLFYKNNPAPLCEAMLWRMKPIWNEGVTHLLCRDLDSPLTYREAQMVQEWLQYDKVIHAITDSIYHNIPLLGGMIGIVASHFKQRFSTWNDLIQGYNYEKKGTDQDMLNQRVYPIYAQSGTESILQHYILGMPNTFLSGYRNKFIDEPLPNVDEKFRMTNDMTGHIGASGWYETFWMQFLKLDENNYKDIENIEQDIFYWHA